MRADEFFKAADVLPLVSVPQLIGDGGLVVIAPHPDDESLGCGGLIAEAVAQGIAVRVIVMSDGTGSHPQSRLYPWEGLRRLREEETLAAMKQLQLDAPFIRFLRLPDQHVPREGALADAAVEAIVATARACNASALCVTWRYDPHCDHEASAFLVERAQPLLGDVRIFEYPIWGWTLPPTTIMETLPQGYRCDITPHLSAKKAAIEAHQSQISHLIPDDPDGFQLPETMIDRFLRPFETFLLVEDIGKRSFRRQSQIDSGYFELLYQGDADPWRFAASDYERMKYEATLRALPKDRYRSVLEAGCSIGVFTKSLALRCDALLAVDASAIALNEARTRCASLSHVLFEKVFLPHDWPSGTFDGIILSEILYYFDAATVVLCASRVESSIQDGGDIILVHWLGETDYPLSGDDAANSFIQHASSFAHIQAQVRTRDYRLDILRASHASKP